MTAETEVLETEPESAPPLPDTALFCQADELIKQTVGEGPEAREARKQSLIDSGYRPEAVEMVFQTLNLFEKQTELDWLTAENRRDRRQTILSITESSYFISRYILDRSKYRVDLEDYWGILETCAKSARQREGVAGRIKQGVLGQVCAYKILQKAGLSPSMATPAQDAYDSTDLITDQKHAVQVAESKVATEPALVTVDYVALLAARVQDPETTTFYSADQQLNEKIQKFCVKLKDLMAATKRRMIGKVLIIPDRMLDQLNGDPSPELLNFFINKLAKSHS